MNLLYSYGIEALFVFQSKKQETKKRRNIKFVLFLRLHFRVRIVYVHFVMGFVYVSCGDSCIT